jgi:hypothetical protein
MARYNSIHLTNLQIENYLANNTTMWQYRKNAFSFAVELAFFLDFSSRSKQHLPVQ